MNPPLIDDCPQPSRLCPVDGGKLSERIAILENEAVHTRERLVEASCDVKDIKETLDSIKSDIHAAVNQWRGARWVLIAIITAAPFLTAVGTWLITKLHLIGP